ncbi:PepSY-associated TM helix domain-containing protein [Bacillus subtilis]|uniref:PepSY-associated TM helix domain-containing protein n=1 Tax=Bacillus subtilis TaxID=1423 RepID=UPI003C1C8F49
MEKSEFFAFRKKEYPKRKTARTSLYQTIWRWHFYAGLIFLPFLLILAVTGGVYLFKPQIENHLYKDLYEVQAESKTVSPSAQFEAVKERYPDAEIVRYRPSDHPERSAEVGIVLKDSTYTVFVNPHNGQIIGQLDDANRIMNKIEEFHGELMAGTAGDRIVELTACWALILIVTGIYLWWPKNKIKVRGVIIPRVTKGKKILTRDLHAVPAFWISAGMLFLVLTGLPWSGLWGNTFQQLTTNSGFGYPPSIWVGEAPTSTQTKEVADVPWAAENLEVPVSSVQQYKKLTIDDVVTIAEEQNITPGYDIYIPQQTDGVYTLSVFPPKAQDEATMHIDQYTGAVLADYRYDNYGTMGKIIALGITMHKGTQFGLINQLLGLMICIGIVAVGISGFILWWKRKPAGKLGAPKSPELKTMKFLTLIIIMFGILFPLVGISLVLVWIIDKLLIKRISKLKAFFNA